MTEPQATRTEASAGQWRVVVNDEGQYSVWSVDRPPPAGWQAEGVAGSREVCLAHIDEVWTDLRPLSLRRAMDGDRQS